MKGWVNLNNEAMPCLCPSSISEETSSMVVYSTCIDRENFTENIRQS